MVKELRCSWSQAWHAVSPNDAEPLFQRLITAYTEPQRHYHTLQHLQECVVRVQASTAMAERPREVELALWFHDAVYDVRAHDNEARSAAWARQEASAAGASADVCDRLHSLVMVTRHSGIPATADERLLVDIDLSVLGADAARFDEYESQVREEYSWVPPEAYRSKRAEILAGFLERPHVFATTHFRGLLEVRARENLQRSLARLGV